MSTYLRRNAPEARYTNQHCRPLHQYKRAKGDGGERAKETAMYDLVSRMLDYDPTFRITLKEALREEEAIKAIDVFELEHTQNGFLGTQWKV